MFTSSSAPASARSVAGGPGCHMSSQIVTPTSVSPTSISTRSRPGGEVAVLVEHAVVGEEALAVDRLHLAVGAHRARVVEVGLEVREADERDDVARLRRDLLQRARRGADEARAAGAGPRAGSRSPPAPGRARGRRPCSRASCEPRQDQVAVAVEVADDRVDLRQREPQFPPHLFSPHRLKLALEADRVQILLADLVGAADQILDVVVLGVEVAPGERVRAARREHADEARRELRRRPRRVVRAPTSSSASARARARRRRRGSRPSSCCASISPKRHTAAFDAEYAEFAEPGRYAAPLPVITIRPRPRSSIPGMTARQQR